jgi:hypothetical protein
LNTHSSIQKQCYMHLPFFLNTQFHTATVLHAPSILVKHTQFYTATVLHAPSILVKHTQFHTATVLHAPSILVKHTQLHTATVLHAPSIPTVMSAAATCATYLARECTVRPCLRSPTIVMVRPFTVPISSRIVNTSNSA